MKVKSADHETIAVARQVATLADPVLGEVYARWAADLGFSERTIASWPCCARTTPASAATPRSFTASIGDDAKGIWLAISEFLEEVELLDSADDVAGWKPGISKPPSAASPPCRRSTGAAKRSCGASPGSARCWEPPTWRR